ncbi:hypothetical protein GVN24_24780 [Rhizobium sp. CRIBSB]|nr:hypothetical protein [Rhizobium sp. CRIBSB]
MEPVDTDPADIRNDADLPAGDGYPDGPVPYTLKRPVAFTVVDAKGESRTETVSAVVVREPEGDDLLAAARGKTEEEKGARLIAALCDQPYAFARKLKGWDFAELGLIVARFFPKEGSPLQR